MAARIPQIQIALNFFVHEILICQFHSQISKQCCIFKQFINNPYAVIWCDMLLTRIYPVLLAFNSR